MSPQLLLRGIAGMLWLLTVPFVRYEYRGGKAVYQHPNWVMSANHRSVFDFIFAVVALVHFRLYSRIMIASEFWDQPVWRWGVKAIDAIPIYRRSDPRGSFAAAKEALADGDSVCIMPEGELFWDPSRPTEMGPVKTGVSRLAVDTEVPVLTLGFAGTERVWPKGRKFPTFWRRHTVVLRLADEPLWLTGDDHRSNADKVKAASESLIRQATRDLQELDPAYLPEVHP